MIWNLGKYISTDLTKDTSTKIITLIQKHTVFKYKTINMTTIMNRPPKKRCNHRAIPPIIIAILHKLQGNIIMPQLLVLIGIINKYLRFK